MLSVQAETEYGNTKPLCRPHFHIPRVCVCCVFSGVFDFAAYAVTGSANTHLVIRECELLLGGRQNKEQLTVRHIPNYNPAPRLTYRQKLLKADLIVLVAVKFLDDVPNHVARLGMPDAFQELVELQVTDVSIFVLICMRKRIKHQWRASAEAKTVRMVTCCCNR